MENKKVSIPIYEGMELNVTVKNGFEQYIEFKQL